MGYDDNYLYVGSTRTQKVYKFKKTDLSAEEWMGRKSGNYAEDWQDPDYEGGGNDGEYGHLQQG